MLVQSTLPEPGAVKRCRRCGVTKPVGDFYPVSRLDPRPLGHCKPCNRVRAPKPPALPSGLKWCVRCGAAKSITDFYCKSSADPRPLGHCKACHIRTRSPRIDRGDERFWSKVDAVGDCWEWTGARNAGGYGRYWRGAGRGARFAHVVAYELVYGPVPTGLVLDHLCRNPRCVNPDHLEAVTTRVNIVVRGVGPIAANARKTHCKRGHAFDAVNTYVIRKKNGRVGRACRACQRVSSAQWKAGRSTA